MTTPTTKQKLEFIFAMAKHSDVPLSDLQRLMRYGATMGKLAEAACNEGLSKREMRKEASIRRSILDILASHRCTAVFSGDPRGCTVKLVVPDGYTNDWGEEGICVPTS